jgi:hypothetical protein
MYKLLVAVLVCTVTLWANLGWAYDLTGKTGSKSSDEMTIGAGGLYISGDDNGTPSENASEFIPTVNLAGLTDMLAWQVFYGFGSDSTVWGGNVDYIVASNFKKCFACPTLGKWWFGVGPTLLDASDLYTDAARPTAALSDTLFGGNLGFGYKMDEWSFNVFAHYLDGQMALQGAVLYNFNSATKSK